MSARKTSDNGMGSLSQRRDISAKRDKVDDQLEVNFNSQYDDVDEKKKALQPDELNPKQGHLSAADKRGVVLLVVLYLLQGIPLGLAFGSIPFILRSKLSYSQIGLFSLCTYPYSLKLLWSPIVDSIYIPSFGKRKSWVVPTQVLIALGLYWLSFHVGNLLEVEEPDVNKLTWLFLALIFTTATQDIAVDGWALNLLSKDNLSYASTAQTVGVNTGYFISFTVFLALNSVEFTNKYFRPADHPGTTPLVTMDGFLRFWSIVFISVTTYVALFQPDNSASADDQDGESNMSLKQVYESMWKVLKLRHVQLFLIVHLLAKIGSAANESVTSLKLLEKGLKKEDLALAVLIDFPFQIVLGYLAARWSQGESPLRPWLLALWSKLGWAVFAMFLVKLFPQSGDLTPFWFLVIVFWNVGSSFSGTVQFVGITAFHTRIADPLIGGTYMTLLNTLSNLGGTWPRFFVLRGVDHFTTATCSKTGDSCIAEHARAVCKDIGGTCIVERDGYYPVSIICITLGVLILVFFLQPVARRLQALPLKVWRVQQD